MCTSSRSLLLATALAGAASPSFAEWQTSPWLSDFGVHMDNGMVYVTHSIFAAPCLHSRVEIRSAEPYSAEYAKRLTALVFGAHLSGKRIQAVWNDSTSPSCVLNSIRVEK